MPLKETVILLDIEGTIASISFVKDVLFPYVAKNLETYVIENWDGCFQHDLELLREQSKIDARLNLPDFVPIVTGENEKQSVINNILWQMSNDRKTMALKQLQGHILQLGYQSGDIKGHLYEDVLPVLNKLKDTGKKICTYSSGSVNAQKLLFEYSMYGNVIDIVENLFDIQMGPKVSDRSYKNIAEKIKVKCSDILFLTDVLAEANAAKEAGCNSILLERPGNAPLDLLECTDFKVIKTLDGLLE